LTTSQASESDRSTIRLANGATGVLSEFSYVWILPGKRGAILVDAGVDPSAKAVVNELRMSGMTPEDVSAILITHGHHDHCAGAAAFPNADVYVMPEDEHMLKDKVARLRILNGSEIVIDGQTIKLFPIPGHSKGSVAFIWKDVCLVGDVITRGERGIAYGPDNYSESPEQNRESVRSLLGVGFSVLATGHGRTVSRKEFEDFLRGQ
jgi:glyoxylase-like metal-dependent hydrolase (beta-lactamase superfamily II)